LISEVREMRSSSSVPAEQLVEVWNGSDSVGEVIQRLQGIASPTVEPVCRPELIQQRATYLRRTGLELKRMRQGRPRGSYGPTHAAVVALLDLGRGPRAIARELGISRQRVYQVFKAQRGENVDQSKLR
jgi:hypothetical protein